MSQDHFISLLKIFLNQTAKSTLNLFLLDLTYVFISFNLTAFSYNIICVLPLTLIIVLLLAHVKHSVTYFV